MRNSAIRKIGAALVALGFVACAGLALAAGPGDAGVPAGHAPEGSKKVRSAAPAALVDINSANRATLKTLPGIGDAEATKIIAARPFYSKADLATKNVIPAGTYLSLKNRIIAKQRSKMQGKTKA